MCCKDLHTCSARPRGSLSISFISPSSWQVSKRNLIISSMFNLLQCCLSKAQASTIHLAGPKQTKSKSQVNKLTISGHINYLVYYVCTCYEAWQRGTAWLGWYCTWEASSHAGSAGRCCVSAGTSKPAGHAHAASSTESDLWLGATAAQESSGGDENHWYK